MNGDEGGFTLVEVLVAVAVSVVFVGVSAQAYVYLSRSLEMQKVHASASEAVNINLERYRHIRSLESLGFRCATHNSANKFEHILGAGDTVPAPPGRIFVEQKITAYTTPGSGCSGNYVVLESAIQYKTHAAAQTVDTARQVIYAR